MIVGACSDLSTVPIERQSIQRLGYNSMDSRGRILVFDSYWLFRDRTLVAHEALHNYLFRIRSPLTGNDNERWVSQWARKCA